MNEPIKLITNRATEEDKVVELLRECVADAIDKGACGVAVALVLPNGAVRTCKFAVGHRALLLGAVTDLQYELCYEGNCP